MAIRTEQTWLADIGAVPDDLEISPGVSAAEMKALLSRPAIDPDGTRFIASVAYSDTAGEIGQMALYARRDVSERAPIVAFAHGGGFNSGHHFGAIRYMHPLAALGFVTATMTYRLSGEAPWPAPIEDAKCAIRWLRHHAHDVGGDPDRIIMVGDSAGAYLSAMMALAPGSYEGDGGWHDASSEVQGAVLFYPPVDMRATADLAAAQGMPDLHDYFGDAIDDVSPINHVRPGCPPILTLTGSADTLTAETDIRRFHYALDGAGVENRLEVFADAPHSFDFHPKAYERCLEMITEFVTETVGHAALESSRRRGSG